MPAACSARAANGQLTAALTESVAFVAPQVERHSIASSPTGIVHHSENTRSCRKWVKRRHSRAFGAFPLYPRKQTSTVYEYTPFCNGPVDVKRPLDRHVAELMLLSVVDAKAAT